VKKERINSSTKHKKSKKAGFKEYSMEKRWIAYNMKEKILSYGIEEIL